MFKWKREVHALGRALRKLLSFLYSLILTHVRLTPRILSPLTRVSAQTHNTKECQKSLSLYYKTMSLQGRKHFRQANYISIAGAELITETYWRSGLLGWTWIEPRGLDSHSSGTSSILRNTAAMTTNCSCQIVWAHYTWCLHYFITNQIQQFHLIVKSANFSSLVCNWFVFWLCCCLLSQLCIFHF